MSVIRNIIHYLILILIAVLIGYLIFGCGSTQTLKLTKPECRHLKRLIIVGEMWQSTYCDSCRRLIESRLLPAKPSKIKVYEES